VKRGTGLMLLEALFVGLGCMSLRCSGCRAHVPLGANYCPGCGARIDWEKLAQSATPDAKGHR
jgi:predicted amidophosphoribosyltransferase